MINDPQTRQPFPDNQVPRSRFDATAVKLLDLWPQANFTGSGTRNNFIRNPPWRVDRDNVDARIDHNISDKDTVFGRVTAGMEAVDSIEGTDTNAADKPVADAVIQRIELAA